MAIFIYIKKVNGIYYIILLKNCYNDCSKYEGE